MPTDPLHKRLSPAAYAAVTDAARRRAVALRREAISAFWAGVARGLRGACRAVRRKSALTPRPARAPTATP